MKKNSALFCLPACLCLVAHRLKHYFRFCCSLQCGDWHSVSVAYQPLVQVSHWAEWQDPWNNSDHFDPHCQHIGLSVSWFHQGHHSTVAALLPMMDHCWAGFLSKPVSFNRNMSWAVNAVSSCGDPDRCLTQPLGQTQNRKSSFILKNVNLFHDK